MTKLNGILIISLLFFSACTKDDAGPEDNCKTPDFFSEYSTRNFRMGFTTWPYGPDLQDVDETYRFIAGNTDIYAEHIDYKIPWKAWMNGTSLPAEFINNIDFRTGKKISGEKLLVSISLLNQERSDLAEDYDGTVPAYTALNDTIIENAYFKHVNYIVGRLQPDYLVIAIEVNELKFYSETKWQEYKLLIANVKSRIKVVYPGLKISESVTLHSLFRPGIPSPEEYQEDVVNYMNQLEFVSISFYPFLKNLQTESDFSQAFSFLHNRITRPIAFVETAQIAEDLSVDRFNLFIKGDPCIQNTYLEALLKYAREQNYEFIIWWAYRDFDALWETFPEELKELVKRWRDTGIIDENGTARLSGQTWETVYQKPLGPGL